SNVGGWMQTVGAQWLMLTLTGSAAYVALVQTASGLPVVLFAPLAGAIGDLVDRRRFLLITQTAMLVAALVLAGLTIANLVSPWSLLLLVFAVGTGQALTSPTWQTLQPELVDGADRTQAIALGAVNQNLARAIGPALGGLILAAAGTGSVFLINSASFLAVIWVLAWWHSSTRAPTSQLPPEHLGVALRAGARYVAASPALLVILLRATVFIVFASALWALLPVIAQGALQLSSSGYGLLLGSVGIGAVAGGALLPILRKRMSPDVLFGTGSVIFAGVVLIVGYVPISAVVGASLLLGGMAWILVLSTLNSLYQLTLPQWVRARGMAFYLIAFQGGNALGSATSGVLAQKLGLMPALTIAAIGLTISACLGIWRRFQTIQPDDLLPAGDWPSPHLVAGSEETGPTLVTVEYWAQAGAEDNLIAALRDTRFSRRRTGASSWRVWRDSNDPGHVVEEFVVASWQEHQRQHARVTVRDQARLERVRALTNPVRPTAVRHWVAPSSGGTRE
ncbi:MAG: MFS transporter, partial [Chloroflexi bacterium]|nr:MFS transporter [Chloroflexota bacterium]